MKIALSVILAFLIVGCSSEAPKEEKVVDTKKIEIVEEKSATEQAGQKITEAKDIMFNRAKEVKDELQEKASDKVEEVKESVKETTTQAIDSVTDAAAEVKSKTLDADLLYNKCAGCHGGMGERAALGKSGVIRNWSRKQIEHAILGYQTKTYGRTMKVMMQKQVEGLTLAEIKALSYYISDK